MPVLYCPDCAAVKDGDRGPAARFQDARYGSNRRVFTAATKQADCCTCCGHRNGRQQAGSIHDD